MTDDDALPLVQEATRRYLYDAEFHARVDIARGITDDPVLQVALGVMLAGLDFEGKPLPTVFSKLEDLGITKERLAGVLESGDNFGHLVHAFEVLTVLGTVQDAWRQHLISQGPKG